MKAERGEVGKRAEPLALEFPIQSVGIVFDDRDAPRSGHLANDIHLAANAGVVHNDNRACLRGNQLFELPFIDAQRAGVHIAEHGRAPRITNALTLDTNVKAGTITSSPGLMSSRNAAISRACVQDVVSSTLGTPSVSSKT